MSVVRLVRSDNDKVVTGVCGGLADYLGIDSVWVRLAFLLLVPAGGIGLPLYITLAVIMPQESNIDKPAIVIVQENVNGLIELVFDTFGQARGRPVGALVLIVVGVYVLTNHWSLPIAVLLVIGLLLMVGVGWSALRSKE
ncbi:MAG TPA: PspC domain-containing protein [Anaerolineae bacterium]|nr:PspC domain-containing protein [Anaerolineae bacterium]